MVPVPTPVPTPIPLFTDTRWLVATLIGSAGLLLGIYNALRDWLKTRRRVLITGRWKWSEEVYVSNPPKPRSKFIEIAVTNVNATPVTIQKVWQTVNQSDGRAINWLMETDIPLPALLTHGQTLQAWIGGTTEYAKISAIGAEGLPGGIWTATRKFVHELQSDTSDDPRDRAFR